MANYNCSFQIINSLESFVDLFYLLMIGSGAGIRVLKDDVVGLPKFRTDVKVYHKEYSPVPRKDRSDQTSMIFEDNEAEIVVGDSKEGWVESLRVYLDILTRHSFRKVKSIIFNYDHVRPKGERLKTFGGTASGHESIKNMFVKIDKTIKKIDAETTRKLRPIDCVDIANIIGENVVVGGVRRTSEIVLFDYDDEDVLTAKEKLYTQENGQWKINQDIIHRQMSNNSIYHKQKPSREFWKWQFSQMRYSGEPGVVFQDQASQRRPDFHGVNPCGEILLNNRGLCNLTTVNVLAFVEDGKLNVNKLMRAQEMSARASYRMTNVELELPKWDKVQAEERLTGCSLTGWQDMVNVTNMGREEQSELLKRLRAVAHSAVKEIANFNGTPESLLTTTVKPEGTLSQLPVVSSGVHYSHSPYYVRRVRVNSHDPIVKVCEELGLPIYPEVGQEWETCSTKVVEFPVKAPQGRTKYDVSAIEQLENYKMFMADYVDHNASVTVSVREHEWEEVEQWVYDNYEHCVALSFLSLDDSFYQLMPYESITEEEYLRRAEQLKNISITPSRIAKYEKIYEELDIEDDGCVGNVCPIR